MDNGKENGSYYSEFRGLGAPYQTHSVLKSTYNILVFMLGLATVENTHLNMIKRLA